MKASPPEEEESEELHIGASAMEIVDYAEECHRYDLLYLVSFSPFQHRDYGGKIG